MDELLDKIDKKILSVLLNNSRTPISNIAKKCLISKQTCHYRIKRLEQEGIIQGYKAKIDISRLGYNTYCIYLKIISMNPEEEKITIEILKNHQNIRWIVSSTGRWDMMIAVSSKDNKEFNNTLKEILKIFKRNIIDYETSIIVSTQDLWMQSKEKINKPLSEAAKPAEEQYTIDDNDIKILEMLQQNARIEVTEISKHVSLSAESISRKIKKLYKDGIIYSFSTSLDREKLGTTWYQVQFQLQNITAQEEKRLIAKIAMIEGVNYIVRMIGKWNFEINMYCKNVGEFRNNLNKIREALSENIRDYYTNIIFEKHKSNTLAITK